MSFKKTMLVGAAVAVTTAGVVGLGVASAATDSDERQGLPEKIAARFNLDKSEVKAVFEEEKMIHLEEMEKKFEQSLDAAVEQGKLTAEQKAKIMTKHAELRQQMESDRETFKDKTKEEIRTIIQERHESLKQWAEANGIPEDFAMPMGGFIMRHDGPMPHHPGKEPVIMFHQGSSASDSGESANQ